MKVLIIPEDPTHDRYILKPVMERVLQDLDRVARVEVLAEPHLRGVDQALDRETIANIVADNPMVDLFLLVVDRDCNRQKNEQRAQAREQEHPDLLACLAIEEVEVWLLALHPEHIRTAWNIVRTDCDPKEKYCDPLLNTLGRDGPGQGRKRGMRALSGNWPRLQQMCPEVAGLKERLRHWLEGRD